MGPKVDATALESDGALIAATAGIALHQAGVARFVINLLPPSLIEARAEKAKIPFLIAAGVAMSIGLVLVMLSIKHDTEVIVAQRDAVQGKMNSLQGFDKKIKAADEAFATTEAEAEALRKLLTDRSSAIQRLNAVRSSLLSGMWIEKWENGKIALRYWKDRVKVEAGKTVGEKVVEKLKGKPVVDKDSVKIADMSTIGKDAQVEQVTVEVKFR